MVGRASTRSPGCARTNSRQIRSRGACLYSGAAAGPRSVSWSMTAKGSGWRRNDCRRGDSCGGRAAKSLPVCSKRIRRSCCWRRATRKQKPRRCGEKSVEITHNKRLAFCFPFWHAAVMPEAKIWRYRGQTIDREQIAFLREFIREHPTASRWKLSRQLCEALGWKQANGALRDVVCRGLLLMLERAGQIELPPVRRQIRGQCRTARPRPAALTAH